MTNGWGPVERDLSNGEKAQGDGHGTLNGVTFAKDLAVTRPPTCATQSGAARASRPRSASSTTRSAPTAASSSRSTSTESRPTTADRTSGNSLTAPLDLDVTGKNELRLVVTNGGDNVDYDHADWANARSDLRLAASAQDSGSTTQTTWPPETAWPTSIDEPGHHARAVCRDLVLHLHRLDDADHLPGLDLVALGNLDRQDCALHRRHDGVLRAACARAAARRVPGAAARARRVAARARAPRPRNGVRPARATAGGRGSAAPSTAAAVVAAAATALRARSASSSDSTMPWQVAPSTKHGCSSSAWWKPSSVVIPPISYSPSARSIRCRACSRSTPWTISLATSGS